MAALRTAHSDFDGKSVIKNELMTAILARYRPGIADGQGRALSALWNGIDDLDAYLFNRPSTR